MRRNADISITEKVARTAKNLVRPLLAAIMLSAGGNVMYEAGRMSNTPVTSSANGSSCGMDLLEPRSGNPYPIIAGDDLGLDWAVKGHYVNPNQAVLVYQGFCGPDGTYSHIGVPQVIGAQPVEQPLPVAVAPAAPVVPPPPAACLTRQDIANMYLGGNSSRLEPNADLINGERNCPDGWQGIGPLDMTGRPGSAEGIDERGSFVLYNANNPDSDAWTVWVYQDNPAELERQAETRTSVDYRRIGF